MGGIMDGPKHILVPLDGSAFAEKSLPIAEAICKAFGAQLTLASVLQVRRISDFMSMSRMRQKSIENEKIRRVKYLKDLVRQIKSKGIKVGFSLRRGSVTETITNLVKEKNVDLVTICTHGRSGVQRWLIGSVANRVVQLINRPVLLLRPSEKDESPTTEFHKLLVTLDGSEFAERVLPFVRLFSPLTREVLLLTVPEIPEARMYGAVVDEIVDLRKHSEDQSREYLEKFVKSLINDGIEAKGIVTGSRPAQTIVSVSEEKDIDLIMMATHGRGGMDRFFIGSVAERVVRHAPCPIILVPIHERRMMERKENR